MATTDAQLIAWLKSNNAQRCVLMEVNVEVGGIEITRYLSDKGYVTKVGETPANTHYFPRISGGGNFTESISLTGETSLSVGAIEFNNFNGEIDSWMLDVWHGRSIKLFIGDLDWDRDDFYQIFDGTVARPEVTTRDQFTLILSDKIQRLNTTVSEVKLGGTSANKDKLVPLLFGECHNITPLLVDLATLEYQVHNGPIEGVIEVRDNGVPIANDLIGWTAVTRDLANGKFTLNQAVQGTITCSAQGDKPTVYYNTVVEIIKRLVKSYGQTAQQFTDADLDLVSLAAFSALNTQPVGLYLTEKANVVDCCNQLASSIGARVTMTRTGLMYIVKLDLPQAVAGTLVTASDMAERGITVSSLVPIAAAIKIAYCKNWTIQTALQTGIPADHIELFAQEWLTATEIDSVVATQYKLFADPIQTNTLLLDTGDAEDEALRILNLWSTQRRVVTYNAEKHLILQVLGASQTIQHERFGLSAGVRGQIVSISINWFTLKIQIGVLV